MPTSDVARSKHHTTLLGLCLFSTCLHLVFLSSTLLPFQGCSSCIPSANPASCFSIGISIKGPSLIFIDHRESICLHPIYSNGPLKALSSLCLGPVPISEARSWGQLICQGVRCPKGKLPKLSGCVLYRKREREKCQKVIESKKEKHSDHKSAF